MTTTGQPNLSFGATCVDFMQKFSERVSFLSDVSAPRVNLVQTQAMTIAQIRWGSPDSINKILKFMYTCNDSRLIMPRKYQLVRFMESTKCFSYKERAYAMNRFRIDEANREYQTMESLIAKTYKAAQKNQIVYKHYRMTASWVKFLESFALDENGCLRDDWRHRLKIVVSNFAGNDKIICSNP